MTAAQSASPLSPLRDPEFAALATARFARGIADATIIIALALYADGFSASGIVAGLFGTAYAVVRLVLALPVGRLVDLGDAKRYLLAGLVLNALILFSFIHIGAVEHVIALRALQAVGATVLAVTVTTVIGDICPDERRGLWLGTSSQVRAASNLAGDVAGGALLYLHGFRTTYLVLIAVTGVATVAVFLFLRDDPGSNADPEERTGVETLRHLLSRSAVRALIAFRFAFSFGKMAVKLFLPIYARIQFGMSPFAIGGILAGGRVMKALTQGYVGSASDRIGHLPWFVFGGGLVYAAGTALIPFAPAASMVIDPVSLSAFGRDLTLPPAFFGLFAVYALLGIADSLRIAPSTTMFVEEGEHYDAVAGAISLRSLSWQVGAILGPFVFGGVLDYTSFSVAFWLAAGIVLGAGGLFVVLFTSEPAPDAAVVAEK